VEKVFFIKYGQMAQRPTYKFLAHTHLAHLPLPQPHKPTAGAKPKDSMLAFKTFFNFVLNLKERL
jgi:hypothetical protein